MWYIPPGNPYNKLSCWSHFYQLILKRREKPHFDYRGATATQMVEIMDNPSSQATYRLPHVSKLEKLTPRSMQIHEKAKSDLSLTMISHHYETDN